MTEPANRMADVGLTPVEKARLEIQESIAQHTQTILEMKHRLNGLALTSTLPPELLSEVFMHLAHDGHVARAQPPLEAYPGPLNRITPQRSPYAWLTVTHVCHHWRAVALGAPQLWSVVWITRPDCVREVLARSRQVPLTIKANALHSRADSLEMIMRELPRIVSFDVKMPPHLPTREYSKEAPRLRELILQSAETYETLSLGSSQLQSHFMTCQISSLERLELYSYQILWTNTLLKPTLKHLTMHGSKLPPTLHMDEVMLALEKLPLLETLDLRGCLPFVPTQGPGILRVVDFAHLRVLRIFSSASSCSRFLQQTTFPAHVVMSLNVQMYTSQDLPPFLPLVFARLNHRSDDVEESARSPALRTLSFRSLTTGTATQLKGWPTFHSVAQLNDPGAKLPDPSVDVIVRYNGPFSVLSLFGMVPTADVESVLLCPIFGSRRAEKSEWTCTFEALPQLRELGLGGWAKDHVHQILDHRISVDDEHTGAKKKRQRRRHCMPSLSVLHLQDVYADCHRDTFIGRLKKSLIGRKKAKLPVSKLVIRNSTEFVEKDIEELKQSVETVDWEPMDRRNCIDVEWSDDDDEEDEDYDYDYGYDHDWMIPNFGLLDPWLPFPGDPDMGWSDEEDEDMLFG